MAWFNRNNKPGTETRFEDCFAPINPQAYQQPPVNIMVQGRIDERRPCWVRGRKALFHCWANVAHPVPPRGVELNEKTRFFQFRRTDAIVEFEDGTVSRCYPNEIQFADTGGFDEFDWRPMAEGGQEDGEE